MAANPQTFEEITEALAPMGVIKGQMYGMPVWKLGDTVIGGPWQGSMVFKLEAEAYDEALALSGAKLFDPMGGRPMKEWVQLGHEHADKWLYYAETAAKDSLQ